MVLTDENYYGEDANKDYVSVSQFKQFFGTLGMRGCEFRAMEELAGRWKEEPTEAMLIGSYVDSYFEGEEAFERFKKNTPELFLKSGELRAAYRHADEIIDRVQRDEYFMKYLSGEKQVIMTGEIAGVPIKIRIDSYIPDIAIVDLKTVKSVTELKWVRDAGYVSWIEYWGYDLQGAVYQEIVRQNTGKKLPFYIAAVSKENEPGIQIIQVTDNYLESALSGFESALPKLVRIKSGEVAPYRCETCACCRHNRVLSAPISIDDLQFMADI